MYLYLGQNTVIKNGDIVGIFDIDGTSVSGDTREYLRKAQKDGFIKEVSPEIPGSFVVCADKTVYLSQLSPATLNIRNNRLYGEREDLKHG